MVAPFGPSAPTNKVFLCLIPSVHHALALPQLDYFTTAAPPGVESSTITIPQNAPTATPAPPAPTLDPIPADILSGVVSSLRPLVDPQNSVQSPTVGCQTTECFIVYPASLILQVRCLLAD